MSTWQPPAGSALRVRQANTPFSLRKLRKLGSLLRDRPARDQALLASSAFAAVAFVWYSTRMAQQLSGKSEVSPPLSQRTRTGGAQTGPVTHDVDTTDPALLQRHSAIKSFTTPRFTYPRIRVFYRRHQQADQLPTTPAPIPLLVFIHGLGGSVAQFNPLLTSLVHLASCLAIDLPGCGRSEFAPRDWEAYSIDALVELLEEVVETYREPKQRVVFIGHSLGCALAARLTHTDSPHHHGVDRLPKHTVGLVAICPPSGPPPAETAAQYRKLLWIPTPIFDLWRAWDRRGGAESASVARFVGKEADAESKLLQYRFNSQSRTPVWRRMAWGTLPTYDKEGNAQGGIPSKEVWGHLHVPLFLVAGEADHVTPPEHVAKIAAAYKDCGCFDSEDEDDGIVDAAAPVDTGFLAGSNQKQRKVEDLTDEDFLKPKQAAFGAAGDDDEAQDYPSTPRDLSEGSAETKLPKQPKHPTPVVRTLQFPAPANHALLYMPSTSRVLAGRISEFLSTCVTGRLSQSWQLQYLSKEGKWDVKNLQKWQKVQPVSDPIGGVFRAMKTLREVDDVHRPETFVRDWGRVIKDVVDISHDLPVYDPAGLEKGGVRYHKFPTVSKIPPTDKEVDDFVRLVDKLRAEQASRGQGDEGWPRDGEQVYVGVHCHYGFNRTGYFIVCYLIERCGYGVQQAIDAFAEARAPGIRHQHFRDALFVRYVDLHDKTAQ